MCARLGSWMKSEGRAGRQALPFSGQEVFGASKRRRWKTQWKFPSISPWGVSTYSEGVSRDKAETLALLSAFVSSQMTVCGHHKSPPPRGTRVESAVGKRPPSYRCFEGEMLTASSATEGVGSKLKL